MDEDQKIIRCHPNSGEARVRRPNVNRSYITEYFGAIVRYVEEGPNCTLNIPSNISSFFTRAESRFRA